MGFCLKGFQELDEADKVNNMRVVNKAKSQTFDEHVPKMFIRSQERAAKQVNLRQ